MSLVHKLTTKDLTAFSNLSVSHNIWFKVRNLAKQFSASRPNRVSDLFQQELTEGSSENNMQQPDDGIESDVEFPATIIIITNHRIILFIIIYIK